MQNLIVQDHFFKASTEASLFKNHTNTKVIKINQKH